MIHPEGVECLPATEAAHRAGVRPVTVRTWHRRGKVTGRTVGRILWVRMPDVYAAEAATRDRYHHQRQRRVQH